MRRAAPCALLLLAHARMAASAVGAGPRRTAAPSASSLAPYDKSVSTFSPDGVLVQPTYAQAAADRGLLCLAVRSATAVAVGALLPAERGSAPSRRTWEKVCLVDEHCCVAWSGLAADGRALVDEARAECVRYLLATGRRAPVGHVATHLADVQHAFTLSPGRRPFGISCLVAGLDDDGPPRVFVTQPTGSVDEWAAAAIGTGAAAALSASLEPRAAELASLDAAAAAALAAAAVLRHARADDPVAEVLVLTRAADGTLDVARREVAGGAEEPS